MMAERGVHLGFARGRIEDIVVADAFLLRQLNRQEQQWRMDALGRRFLEVVPAQKAKHDPELREAVLRPVAPRFADNLVEHTGKVGRILKAEIFAERHWRALRHSRGEFGMPDKKLL